MDIIFTQSTTSFKTLYRVAGSMALLIVLAGLVDVITSMGVEARDNRSFAVLEWFTLFQTNTFSAFSRLGLINIITVSLGVPIYLAFPHVFPKDRKALVTLASLLFFVGTIVYLSSNTVFAMFGLSQQYAAAAEVQKPLFEAAGRALLAQGADLTPGTFFGLVCIQFAGLLVTSQMPGSHVFGKWTSLLGLAGYSLMVVFFILTAFFPELYSTAMLVAVPGGLTLLAYEILLARRFFQLGK